MNSCAGTSDGMKILQLFNRKKLKPINLKRSMKNIKSVDKNNSLQLPFSFPLLILSPQDPWFYYLLWWNQDSEW
jgi:hypothetical protein